MVLFNKNHLPCFNFSINNNFHFEDQPIKFLLNVLQGTKNYHFVQSIIKKTTLQKNYQRLYYINIWYLSVNLSTVSNTYFSFKF